MGRLKEVKKYVNKQLAKMDDQDDALKAAGHLYGVSMSAQLLAQKRGENAEFAGIAGFFMICTHMRADHMRIMPIKGLILRERSSGNSIS